MPVPCRCMHRILTAVVFCALLAPSFTKAESMLIDLISGMALVAPGEKTLMEINFAAPRLWALLNNKASEDLTHQTILQNCSKHQDEFNAMLAERGLNDTKLLAKNGTFEIQSSAEDIAHIFQNQPVEAIIPNPSEQGHPLAETQRMAIYSDGMGLSGVAVSEYRTPKDRRMLLAIVNHATNEIDLNEQIRMLFTVGYRDYKTIKLFKRGEVIHSTRIYKGEYSSLPLVSDQDVYVSIRNTDQPRRLQASISMRMKSPIIAPIKKGTLLGTASVLINRTPVKTFDLFAGEDVRRGNFIQRAIGSLYLASQNKNQIEELKYGFSSQAPN